MRKSVSSGQWQTSSGGRIVRIDALVGKVETSIAMLREYRTALISAAVTGKIDVREEVVA